MLASKAWRPVKRHVRSYTGGPVAIANNEAFLATACGERVGILDLATGGLTRTFPDAALTDAQEPIVNFVVSPTSTTLATVSRSSLITLWDISSGTLMYSFKGPRGVVNSMAFDSTGHFLATAAADRSVMVFDVEKKFCTHSFKGHKGNATLVAWHPQPSVLQLVSAGDDSTVFVWDLRRNACIAKLTDHLSVVTCIAFAGSADAGWTMFTGGRDQVINVWDAAAFKLRHTQPVFETLEGLAVLSCSEESEGVAIRIASAGARGALRVWTCVAKLAKCTFVLEREVMMGTLLGAPADSLPGPDVAEAAVAQQVIALLHAPTSGHLLCVTGDHNVVTVSDVTLARVGILVGYNDDIIDVKYVPSPAMDGTTSRKVAVATNSEQLRLFDVDTFDTQILSGHTASILSVDTSPDGQFVATASKDSTARIWNVASGSCVGLCEGHTMAVGAVAWPKRARPFHDGQTQWLVTGSKDRTLKVWNIGVLLEGTASSKKHKKTAATVGTVDLKTICAVSAHDKDVNQVAVSPNDALIASASQDKTVKLWRVGDLGLVGVLRGHKRGVWAVEFSPVDKCVASASGDQTVRLWSVTDFSCIRTLEGHTASVLCVRFLRQGTQIMSTSADGLLKLWNVKDSECVSTLKGHEERVWTVAMAKARETIPGDSDGHVIVEREMVSGGGDSVLCVWADATREEEAEARAAADAAVLQQQELYNRMAARDYPRTVELCIKLEQPGKLLAVLTELLDCGPTPVTVDTTGDMLAELEEMEQESSGRAWIRGPGGDWVVDTRVCVDRRVEGAAVLSAVLKALSPEGLDRLLRYVRDWNTQSKHNLVAQQILNCTLRTIPMAALRTCPSFADVIKGILPYSERHLERMNRMLQSSYFLDYVESRMVIASGEAEEEAAPAPAPVPSEAAPLFLKRKPEPAAREAEGEAPAAGKKAKASKADAGETPVRKTPKSAKKAGKQ